jgi:mycothiol synthase
VGELGVRAISAHELKGLAGWVHANLPSQELAALLTGLDDSIRSRLSPFAFEIADPSSGQCLAAAYFLRLPGRVATLGGVRAIAGKAELGVKLVEELVNHSQRNLDGGCSQIQAIVSSNDRATADMVRKAGFTHLTNVQHLWLNPMACPPLAAEPRPDTSLRWLPAPHLARRRMAQLLGQTFVDTLDCPAINGLRSEAEVLDGFLGGQKFRQLRNWELLEVDGAIAGCLMLTSHSEDLVELVYMGVKPEFRGQGLGSKLVARAIESVKLRGASMLVVAVDEQNWPARQLYMRSGFIAHATLSVWLVK